MFDHVAPTVFWPLFVIVVFAASWLALWAFTRFIDRTNPYPNIEGRKRMARDWRRPDYLPEDWQ